MTVDVRIGELVLSKEGVMEVIKISGDIVTCRLDLNGNIVEREMPVELFERKDFTKWDTLEEMAGRAAGKIAVIFGKRGHGTEKIGDTVVRTRMPDFHTREDGFTRWGPK